MTYKRQNLNEDTCPTLIKKSRNHQPSASVSFSTAPTTREDAAQGLRKTNHGVIFQLKLLMLFLIRGIEAGYMFQLGTEMEELGGKFDDLIFKYEVEDNTPAGKHFRYRYLQAKHKQKESFQITAAQLVNDNAGDFSLLKYFRSYCDIIARGEDIEDCIICTNVGFKEKSLKKNGIELVSINTKDKMFSFGKHPLIRYKIKIKSNHKLYTTLHAMSIDDPAKKTPRNVASKEIEGFFEKLVFVVNAPNEVDLGRLLTDEVGSHYNVKEADFQSDFILRNMLDWFKKKESNFMTSKDGIDLFQKGKEKMKSLRRTSVSIHYQRQLRQVLEFNRDAIREMADKLKSLLISSNKVEHIWTRLPKRTAVKVIEGLKKLGRNATKQGNRKTKITDAAEAQAVYFQREDSYLVTSLAELNKDYNIFEALLQENFAHNLLIVVCEDDASIEKKVDYAKLVKNPNKKVIVIGQGDAAEGTRDDLKFADLSTQFKKSLLSKEVLFQGTRHTVGNLIKRSYQSLDDLIESSSPGKLINSDVMEELIKKERVEIAQFTSPRFEKSLYIKRQLTSAFPFDNRFWSEVANELGYSTELLESKCRISLKGEIEWFATGDEKTNIWKKINIILEKRKSRAHLPPKSVAEDDLVNNQNHQATRPNVVIVSGVAGSGKSSILSHFCEVIKEKKPEHWVIVISLTDHSEAFSKLKSTVVNKSSVGDFLLNLAVADKSPFACSLLRHRLKTGNRMVVMLDGFDESHYQETVIDVIKVFKEIKLRGLFVTTRSHVASQIQFELSQLTYSLNNFGKRDQIKYLTSVWQRDFTSNVKEDLRNLARSLVDRVSETLRDEERAFIGIPLQCRILAECFQSELQKSFQQDKTFDSFLQTIQHLNLSLASLYRLLMEKKHDIYRQEKKAQSCASDLANSHAREDIDNLEPFLRKLAIETIVSFKEHVDALLGKNKSMKPKDMLDKKKKKMVDHCARFGLLDRDAEGKVQFLHRTYAEYLMAEYLYTGFLLDDEKRNKLLDHASARKLIIGKILVKNQYDGVQIFLDSMLKEIVDDNIEWRNGIVQGELPDGLHKVAQALFTRVVHLKIKENPLELSVANKREKIFKFLCDCLDATFDKPDVLQAIRASFSNHYSFKNFCHLNSEVFQRYIDYFDNVPITHNDISEPKEKNHVHTVMEGLFGYRDEFPPCGLKYSFWDGEEQKKMVQGLLHFLDKHRQVFNEIIPKEKYSLGTMLAMLIFNKNYDSHLELFVKLLSQSDLYSDDSTFANFMKDVFLSVKRKHRMGRRNRLKKILAICNELDGRHDLLNQMCGEILKIEPNLFKMVYKPCQLFERDAEELPKDFHLLLERDSFRMSCFHIRGNCGTKQTDLDDKNKDLVKKLLTAEWTTDPESSKIATVYTDYNDFTPFYVAAIWGHEKICCNLLAFLKRHLPDDALRKGLIGINGFVHRPLSDAIASENTEMYNFILKIVKKTLGQADLVALLKSTIQEEFSSKDKSWKNDWTNTSMFTVGCQYKMFQTIADVVLDRNNVTGKTNPYEDLNDLIFSSDSSGRMFASKSFDATILQGLMSLEGSDDWTKRFLNSCVYMGFTSLVNYCIQFFNQDQLLQLVNTITSKGDRQYSYWSSVGHAANVGNEKYGVGDLGILKFLKFISKKLGETILIKLLLHDEGYEPVNDCVLSQSLVNIYHNLSEVGKEKVRHHFKTYVPLMIERHFFNPDSEHYWQVKKSENWISLSQIYLDYANDDQLKKFVNFITHEVKAIYGNGRSIWSYVFLYSIAESNRILKLVHEKPATFGQDAVKTLLYHECDKFPVVLRAALKDDFNGRIMGLPSQVQDEIQNYVAQHKHELIEECFRNPITEPGISWQHFNLNKFICILNYCNCNELQEFVTRFTSLHDETDNPSSKKRSIWGKIFADTYVTGNSIQTMHKFLKCVSEKLGQNDLMRLVLHDDGDGAIICSKALEDQESLIETTLTYLDAKNKKTVRRKINDYLAEKLEGTGAEEYKIK